MKLLERAVNKIKELKQTNKDLVEENGRLQEQVFSLIGRNAKMVARIHRLERLLEEVRNWEDHHDVYMDRGLPTKLVKDIEEELCKD